MKRIVFVAGCVLVAVLALGAAVAPSVISKLQSEQREEREKAREEILESRRLLIDKLIELAGEDRPGLDEAPNVWRDSKHLSILLLGELRATEAIEVLFENLTYGNPLNVTKWYPPPPWENYPALGALIKIGMPALPGALELLKTSEDERERENCYWLIRQVLGIETGRFVVASAVREERDPERKSRLEAALKKWFPEP